MLEITSASVFNSPAEVITNTVNCEGVMGAGLALEFALRHPELEADYQHRCQQGRVQLGHPYLFAVASTDYRAVLNFPTKKHWRFPSRLEWIAEGLSYIAQNYARAKPPIRSLALPHLGCDRGGLDWADVRHLIVHHLSDLPGLMIYLCDDTDEAAGREASMIHALECDLVAEALPGFLKGTARKALLQAAVPKRFRHLAAIPGIGQQSYARLFQHYYQLEPAKVANQLQLLP